MDYFTFLKGQINKHKQFNLLKKHIKFKEICGNITNQKNPQNLFYDLKNL